jgi:hypothetical protein
MKSFFTALLKKENLPLFLIMLVATLLRLWHLNFQSVWLDEIHTLREADPSIPLSETIHYLHYTDQHPPLYFFLQRLIFGVFGNTTGVCRVLSAIAGIIGVWAIYLLGKEIKDKGLGLILAAITAINYFSIYYSQEARDYITVFLFTILSLLYFVRLIKGLDKKAMWLYALFTLLMLYSHYFGLFVIVAQYVIAFILMLVEKEQKKLFIRRFIIAGVAIVIGYAPWMPILLDISKITSFWVPFPQQDFYVSYFNGYFGYSAFLTPFLFILLSFFSIRAFMEKKEDSEVRQSPLLLGFTIFLPGVVVTYLIPYVRSVLKIPMLFDRYTIVVLPFFLLAVAYGIYLISNLMVRYIVLGTFILLSLVNIFISQQYYTGVHKTQFRELMAFVAQDHGMRYPLVNKRISWQLQYYTDRNKEAPPIIAVNPPDAVDSILKQASPRYEVPGFWLIEAHGGSTIDNCVDTATMKRLLTKFVLVKEIKLYDAWAQLYLSIDEKNNNVLLRPANFPPGAVANAYNETLITNWGGIIRSNPFRLKKGEYTITIDVMGTAGADSFPHLNIYIQDKKVANFYTAAGFNKTEFEYTMPADADSAVIKIELDNDYFDPSKGGGDRNAFIRNIFFRKK